MKPTRIRILPKATIKMEDLDKLSVYQCQCCKPRQMYHFKLTEDGLCPDHHYPLHYLGPLPVFYRSLGADISK